jgi:hypothetical protein
MNSFVGNCSIVGTLEKPRRVVLPQAEAHTTKTQLLPADRQCLVLRAVSIQKNRGALEDLHTTVSRVEVLQGLLTMTYILTRPRNPTTRKWMVSAELLF